MVDGGGGHSYATFPPLEKTTLHPDNPAAAFRRWRRKRERERDTKKQRGRWREIETNW